LGPGGVFAIKDPPFGPVAVSYTDLDDVAAKSMAARARQAFDERQYEHIWRVLKNSKTMLEKALKAYDKYYNDLSGKGLIEDIYQEITDPVALVPLEGLLAIAQQKTRRQIEIIDELE
jgi:hypothetical protein